MSQDVCIRSLSQKQETRGWESLTKPGVPREQVQRSRKDACSPQKQLLSLLSSCPPHQLTQLQQTSPMLSSTACQLKPQGMPGREGSRVCIIQHISIHRVTHINLSTCLGSCECQLHFGTRMVLIELSGCEWLPPECKNAHFQAFPQSIPSG
jgi:hypothetical protein